VKNQYTYINKVNQISVLL